MKLFNWLVPSWLLWAAALGVLVGVFALAEHLGDTVGAARVQAKWDADKIARDNAQLAAIATRNKENADALKNQREANDQITKGKDDEILKIRAALATSERMRLGAAWCGSDGSAGTAGTASPGGSNGNDPAGRLLPESLERDIRALILETEEAAATGRAAQLFIRNNGMAP